MPQRQFLEEGQELSLDWQKLTKVIETGEALLPVVVQDELTKEVLLIAYLNEEALRQSLLTKKVTLYSTSRRQLWLKGATSGDILWLKEVRVNCEQNSLLFLVERGGLGACHTKNKQGKNRKSCFYRRLEANGKLLFLEE